MKKIISGLVLALVLFGTFSIARATTYDDLMKGIDDLKVQISDLRSQLATVLISLDSTSRTATVLKETTLYTKSPVTTAETIDEEKVDPSACDSIKIPAELESMKASIVLKCRSNFTANGDFPDMLIQSGGDGPTPQLWKIMAGMKKCGCRCICIRWAAMTTNNPSPDPVLSIPTTAAKPVGLPLNSSYSPKLTNTFSEPDVVITKTISSDGSGFIATPAISSSTNTSTKISISPVKKGDKGTDVTKLQKYLISVGFLPADTDLGLYGSITTTAVKAFQKANGIDGDGTIVGPKTLSIMNGGNGNPPGTVGNDWCPNFIGTQSSIPTGYQQDANGNCICANGTVGLMDSNAPTGTIPVCVTLPNKNPVTVIDRCPNLSGTQIVVPSGYQIVNGQCVTIPDICPNITGIQATVPAGYINIPNIGCVPVVTTTIPFPGTSTKGNTNPTICALPNKSFLTGGHDRHVGFSEMWSFISNPVQWSLSTNSNPVPYGDKSHHASAVFQDKLWVMGGIHTLSNGVYSPLNDIWKYDGTTWSQTTAPWAPRYDFSVNVFQNKLWLMGGSDSSTGWATNGQVFGDTWTFNGTNWTQWDNNTVTPVIDKAPWATPSSAYPWVASFPNSTFVPVAGRTAFKSAVFNNQIWLMGGAQTFDIITPGSPTDHAQMYVKDVWSFDGTTWTPHGNAPWDARPDFVLLPLQGKLWLMGGQNWGGNNPTYNDVWSFDGATWTHFDHDTNTVGIQDAPWTPRAQFAGIVSNNKIYITGGDDDVNLLNDVWAFDGTTWTKVDNIPGTGTPDNAPWSIRDGMSWASCQ